MDIPTCFVGVLNLVAILAVALAGRVGFDLADELVLFVHVDRQHDAEAALAVLLLPGGVDVLLPSLGQFPVRRHRGRVEQFLLVATSVLLGRSYEGSIDDLAAAGDETLLEQLLVTHQRSVWCRPRRCGSRRSTPWSALQCRQHS